MYTSVPTLTDHILDQTIDASKSWKDLALLLVQLENVTKIIGSHVKASGLVDILGQTDRKNSFGEVVQKLDEFSNNILVDTLLNSGIVHSVVSEEMETEVRARSARAGEFIVYIDPLDGSSNIDTNRPIGTIFSIYHKDGGLLQSGRKQIAAGYIMYGSSVMFVYTIGKGVHGFTLDPAIGSFLLSHQSITVPSQGSIYSVNEANAPLYNESVQRYLSSIKQEKKVKARYVGSLVADAHRTLLKGGIFLYPADKGQPDGKLRLLLEVNPFSFLFEQAKGKAIGMEGKSPLDIMPDHIHQRAPLIMGSVQDVDTYTKLTRAYEETNNIHR